jgi:CRISPR-associated endonuclease Cas1
MVATQTVPQHLKRCNFTTIKPRNGVITLYGYGIHAQVERGHLALRDGIGFERRHALLPRVGHGLRRLVVVGSDGIVSLAALRWLADQRASFVMLDKDGTPLITTGPVRSSDARLRRAQALAQHSGVAIEIARELILKKLAGQESVCRDCIHDIPSADAIVDAAKKIPTVKTVSNLRLAEAQAGAAYWSAWHELPIPFPRADLKRVPAHWLTFGSRKSSISGSPRLAVNPANAVLNFLYAVLESESRLALAALGLDPGIGVLHADLTARDSLACDLMEPVRPQIDRYLLEWIQKGPLRRDWFFEERNGNCRLVNSLAARLSETASMWGCAVAMHAERIAQMLWSAMRRPSWDNPPATRLTHRRRLEARGRASSSRGPSPRPPVLCRICGTAIKTGDKSCIDCKPTILRENMIEIAKLGRVATISPEAQKLRAATQRRQAAALRSWTPSENPEWLTEAFFKVKVQPLLVKLTASTISSTLGVSHPYATSIKKGQCVPHPRHWQKLAKIVNVLPT